MPGCMHGKIYCRVEANGGERRPAPIPPSRWVRLKIASRRCYGTAGRDAKDYNGVKHFLMHEGGPDAAEAFNLNPYSTKK